MKYCRVCCETLPIDKFSDSQVKLNSASCKDCRKGASAKYRKDNRDKIALRRRELYKINGAPKLTPEQKNRNVETNKKYKEKNREKVREWNRKCARKNATKYKCNVYGISVEEYEIMAEEQGGLCAICGKPETAKHNDGKTRGLSIDHCHVHGAVRGLLCGRCNTGLGLFGDSVRVMNQAIDYINKSN